jgi:hypothetical protein
MPIADSTDNFDEALSEDNFDEAGQDEATEPSEDSGNEPDFNDPVAWLKAQDSIPEEVMQAVEQGFLRRADYSQKTADVARKRELVDEIILREQAGKSNAQEKPAEEVKPPSLKEGATPEQVIDFYVQQAVQDKLKALGVGSTVEQMKPLVDQQRVVDAYREYASENPGQDHATLSSAVGQVLDTDPELAELAQSNPRAAVRAAARIAAAELKIAKGRVKKKQKRATAPASARAGASRIVEGGKRLTPLEAATQALKEQGAL